MSDSKDALTADRARARLNYNPDTGRFIWKPRPLSDFKTEGAGKTWSSRFAGKETGSARRLGYLRIKIDGRLYQAHRVAWLIHFGRWPVDQIDHTNQDRGDNRIANLREVTHRENGRNQSLHNTNTSGHAGVCWHKGKGKWYAQIKVDGRLTCIGYFDRKESAIAERELAEIIHGFFKNHGKTPVGKAA